MVRDIPWRRIELPAMAVVCAAANRNTGTNVPVESAELLVLFQRDGKTKYSNQSQPPHAGESG